jgi:hypothetical protein
MTVVEMTGGGRLENAAPRATPSQARAVLTRGNLTLAKFAPFLCGILYAGFLISSTSCSSSCPCSHVPMDQSPNDSSWANKPLTPKVDNELWSENMCTLERWSPLCTSVIVLERQNVTFCSAAKVASTAIRSYFFNIADGDVAIPPDAKYPIHQASWTFLKDVSQDLRKQLVTGNYSNSALPPQWTQVIFMKHVVQRFVSGFLDKVVSDCSKPYDPSYAIYFYEQFGFSCEKHQNFEEFITFMESVPKMETHFAPQSFLCQYGQYPFTHLIFVDQKLNQKLANLSGHLGVNYHSPDHNTASHKTGSERKMARIFKGRKDLLQRVLNIFEQDCKLIPKLCEVEALVADI